MAKMTLVIRTLLAALLVLSALTYGRVAAADDKLDQAAQHFERGLQLYSESAFEAALVEFERAYQLVPSYKIIYNEARIHRAMNHYAEALVKFEQYLREGGEEIAAERRAEVQQEIASLKPRVASIEVRTNIAGADVSMDDVPLGQSPVPRAIIVDPGVRKVTATKQGYIPVTRTVRVVGSDAIVVQIDLVALSAGKQPDKPVDPGPRNRAILGWTATGLLTTGAVVSGVLALNASSSLEDAKTVPNQDYEVLKDEANKLRTLSILTDVFTGAAVIAGGISVYLTVKAVQDPDKPKGPEVAVRVGPGHVVLLSRF